MTKLVRSKKRKIKLDGVDKLFSLYIRNRDAWTCQKCGTYYPVGAQGLHCSHLFSRRHKSIRWEPLNAVAHCFNCHMWFGGNPIEAYRWIVEYLGEERLAELERMKAQTVRDNETYRQEQKAKLRELLSEIS